MMYVVAYDIVSARRRRRLRSLLLDLGLPAQKSVFECELEPQALANLRARLAKAIRPAEDLIGIWPLCRTCWSKAVVMRPKNGHPGPNQL